jgi:hypothetical protein
VVIDATTERRLDLRTVDLELLAFRTQARSDHHRALVLRRDLQALDFRAVSDYFGSILGLIVRGLPTCRHSSIPCSHKQSLRTDLHLPSHEYLEMACDRTSAPTIPAMIEPFDVKVHAMLLHPDHGRGPVGIFLQPIGEAKRDDCE